MMYSERTETVLPLYGSTVYLLHERGLKQPFEQVWEPVTDAALVRPGRYDGCTVPLHMPMNKEKYSWDEFTLDLL